MSQWQNYGFPDLSGVHFQIALQGLLYALKERILAVYKDDYSSSFDVFEICDEMQITAIPDAVNRVDNVFYYLEKYILPDGNTFTLENAAKYLNEDLIKMNQRYEGSFPYADAALKYGWLLQRYRFINLAWKTAPSMQYCCSIYEKSSGSGDTFQEAVSRLEREDYYNESYNTFEMSLITERWEDSLRVSRYLRIPDRVKYFPSAPGLLCLEITPRMTTKKSDYIDIPENALEFSYKQDDTFRQWQAYDFNCGLQFNTPQIFFSQPVPAGIAPGTEVKLSGLYEKLSARGDGASFPVPQTGYDYSMFARGFSAELSCFCDFRNYFDFYDPPEKQKKGFI